MVTTKIYGSGEALTEFFDPQLGGNAYGSALDVFSIANRVTFDGGVVTVTDYTFPRPTADLTTFDDYFLDFAVSRRPGPAWASYEDGPRVSGRLGRILFVPAGRTVRSGSGVCGAQRSMSCALSAAMFDRILPQRPPWGDDALAGGLHLGGHDIEWVLFRIYNELRQAGFASRLVVESLATALTVALIRKLGLDHAGVRSLSSGGMAPWRMQRIRDRVQANLPPPGLGELAELCGVSVRQLTRAFKAETGQTIAQYVQYATIERAYVMLSEPNASVGEIAQALGFANSTSFAYAFRCATGLLPKEVERQRQSCKATGLETPMGAPSKSRRSADPGTPH